MDYDNLNHDEVTELINKLKYPKKIKSFEECFSTVSALFGKVNIDEPVIDRENEIEYVLHAYRGNLEASFSIHLRFKEFHHHLVRVDINPHNRHFNPDGKLIIDSHIHIYTSILSEMDKDKVAIPLKDSDFPNVNTLAEAFSEFIKYTHIEEGD